MIKLNSIDRTKFAYEIKKIDINDSMTFQLTNAMAQNIKILFYYLELKKVKNITIHKESESLDIICYKHFINYMQKYYLRISKVFNIKLEGFLRTELQILLGERFYLNYCSLNNIEPEWNENYLKKEKRKIFKNKHLLKYETFKNLIKFQENTPFSYFNFPNEKDADRFVFYFNMHSEKQKQKILNLIKELKIENYNPKLVELIQTNKINEEIFYYALGFIYQDNELHRLTLYTKFDGYLIQKNLISKFLKEKHNLTNIPEYKNMWYYAIDFFKDGKEEIKLYDEPYLFKEELNDKIMQKTLQNKMCVRVLKYKDNIIKDIKYEFEYKYFNKNEIETLKQNNLYNKNSKVFAIYIKDNKIQKKVNYEL